MQSVPAPANMHPLPNDLGAFGEGSPIVTVGPSNPPPVMDAKAGPSDCEDIRSGSSVKRDGSEEVANVQAQMIASRLGVFSGLFYALRAKHPPTAAHGLRVAIGCSKWAGWREMPEAERSLLEVAALLHDVGKIGVPDSVLQKPTRLDGQEQLMMEMKQGVAAEMLRAAGANDALLEIIGCNCPGGIAPETSWDETREPSRSISARMLAIVDAFDSMASEQVFRKALSRERAIEELFAGAGTQFDGGLVEEFVQLICSSHPGLESATASRWLSDLNGGLASGFDHSGVPLSSGVVQTIVDTVFHRKLLHALTDAAVYLNSGGEILHWNRAAERLTGRLASALIHKNWSREMMGLAAEDGTPLEPVDCPLAKCLTTNTQVSQRLMLRHVEGQEIQVHVSAIPVVSANKERTGAILLVRDASTQVSLEARVQSLHAIASRDPLTKVANRVSLDGRLPNFVREHLETGRAGSVMICDIDHFKRINDNYGHQAGDDALVTFAGLLSEMARDGDLVARFGGEEFVILCEGCDNPAATSRAEDMRRAVERTPVPALKGNTLTASFGVTEVQPGDSHETVLARADRALLMAKESGRNRVVQLGIGQEHEVGGNSQLQGSSGSSRTQEDVKRLKPGWLNWFRSTEQQPILKTELLASVPKDIVIRKLSGFINDHKAEVLKTDDTSIALKIDGINVRGVSRRNERPTVLLMDVRVQQVEYRTPRANVYQKKTLLGVCIRPVKPRDRRADALQGQAAKLLTSFSAYLVAQVVSDEMRESIILPRE